MKKNKLLKSGITILLIVSLSLMFAVTVFAWQADAVHDYGPFPQNKNIDCHGYLYIISRDPGGYFVATAETEVSTRPSEIIEIYVQYSFTEGNPQVAADNNTYSCYAVTGRLTPSFSHYIYSFYPTSLDGFHRVKYKLTADTSLSWTGETNVSQSELHDFS